GVNAPPSPPRTAGLRAAGGRTGELGRERLARLELHRPAERRAVAARAEREHHGHGSGIVGQRVSQRRSLAGGLEELPGLYLDALHGPGRQELVLVLEALVIDGITDRLPVPGREIVGVVEID